MSSPYGPDGGAWSAGDGRGWSSASGRGGRPDQGDDGWGPSTAVRAGSAGSAARTPSAPDVSRPHGRPGRVVTPPPARPDDWNPAGPRSTRDQRRTRDADRRDQAAPGAGVPRAPERGLPWWAALLLLIAVAAVGGIIDTLGSLDLKGGFNVGIVVASIVAILAVKRSNMFPVVIAPPIVYSAAAVFQLYVRSSGLHDKKVVFDAAANYLVYGFPAIAAATAAVLIIAGIRLITRR